jgi:Domain of Unknown Function (DUF349)
MENDKEVNQASELVAGGNDSGAAFMVMEGKSPEPDLNGEALVDHAADQEDPALPDFSQMSKKEMLDVLKELLKSEDFKRADTIVKELKPLYDEIRTNEKAEALIKFKSEGGNEDDFEYRYDETDHHFEATLKLLRDKRTQFYKSIEEKKSENLRKKNEILEQLRVLMDGEDSPNSFHKFKELQHQWKLVGPVPMSNLKTLWANYNALIDRFYDHRSIYFELKELDRKKNLETKLELCNKAEKMVEASSIKNAVHELNDLHNEFRHIGPVPKEDQENVWQRFKKASDQVYAKRDALVAELHLELKKNLEAKSQLSVDIAEFASFTSDRIKDWNEKTKAILELQKKWDGIGAMPRTKAKDLNKKFWSSFKSFFHNKGLFFKKLDEERSNNLKAKQELVQRAMQLKSSEDWAHTSQEMIELQRKWKDIGPVPEKQREKIFKEFKEACDFFFEQRRGTQVKADLEQEDNLKKKESIIEGLLSAVKEGIGNREALHQMQLQFASIGFVPKNAMASVRSRFNEATSKYIELVGNLNPTEKDSITLEAELTNLRNDPQAERKLFNKEQTLRKQITKAENDLAVLRNNLEFFGRSKNAEKMKGEFSNQIEEANQHLMELKKQLKLLKSV